MASFLEVFWIRGGPVDVKPEIGQRLLNIPGGLLILLEIKSFFQDLIPSK